MADKKDEMYLVAGAPIAAGPWSCGRRMNGRAGAAMTC